MLKVKKKNKKRWILNDQYMHSGVNADASTTRLDYYVEISSSVG
jgi:hypothetical protein